MSGPAKVIVVDADPAVSAALRFGLLRAGLAASAVATSTDFAQVAQGASLVLVGDDSGAGGGGAAVVGQVRQRLDAARLSTPILYIGDHATRRDVEQAGADEAVLGPVFLRDLAQVARIMLCERRAEGWGGTLAELAGVLGLARALSALGRSGVLTLTRGIRRGEIRYYHGEITSAQVGIIHGQAAFHQLLLWTEARFDFRQELVVRRQQIPLPPEEVMADAERFLESIRDIAGGLSPSVVLDVIPERIGALAIKIPTEVHGILNMFDGRRMLVDILEDSPYRVHETLRVVRKGFESKVLRVVPQARSRRAWREPLPIEDWLLGNDSPTPGLLGDDTDPDSGRRHKRDSGPLEWAALVPRTSNLDMPTLSPIVPASKVAGEIHVAGDDGRAEAAQVGRKVIVSEDAIMTPADRAEEARLVQERAMREAAEEAVTANVTREAAVAKAAQDAAEAAAAREAEAAAKAAQDAAEAAAAREAEAAAKAAQAAAAREAEAAAKAAQEAAEAREAEAVAAAKAALEEAAAKAAQEAAEAAAAREAEAAAKAAQEAAAKATQEAAANAEPQDAALAGAVAAASAARLAAEQHAAAVAIASAETLPVTRPGAPRRSTTSDILPKNKKRKRPKTSQSVVVDPSDPAPLALVADLQAAHDAVSGLAAAQAAAAASPDVGAAGAALSAVAQQVTEDASKAVAAFTADEEAFFQAGHHHHHHPVDSFADLDVGHRRPSFWQRLFGRPVPRE